MRPRTSEEQVLETCIDINSSVQKPWEEFYGRVDTGMDPRTYEERVLESRIDIQPVPIESITLADPPDLSGELDAMVGLNESISRVVGGLSELVARHIQDARDVNKSHSARIGINSFLILCLCLTLNIHLILTL
jgi:hypothetical protein